MHLLLDHDGCLPCFANMTEGAVHEINVARSLDLPTGAIVAMDRGYVDFTFFDTLEKKGVFFVTRLKENAVFEIQEEFSSPKGNILKDELIRIPGSGSSFNPERILRCAVLWYEEKQSKLVLLTNNRKLSSPDISSQFCCGLREPDADCVGLRFRLERYVQYSSAPKSSSALSASCYAAPRDESV